MSDPARETTARSGGDVTILLQRWANGDRQAFEALMPVVYQELRRLARSHMRRENEAHTFQPTDLVHEAYLRLSGVREIAFTNRAHFYGAAAQVMRRLPVDHARRRKAAKRDARIERFADLESFPAMDGRIDLSPLDDALHALTKIAPEKAKVVRTPLLRRAVDRENSRVSRDLARHGEATLDLRPGLALPRDVAERGGVSGPRFSGPCVVR